MRISLILISSILLLSGCASQLPIPANYPISTQKKARAAHHWDVLADDIALQTQIAAYGKESAIRDKPVYVREMREATPFNKAFRNFLITRLVNRGLAVNDHPVGGTVEINYDTQIVRHASNRYTHIPGTVTALTAGLWVIHGMVESGAEALPAALGVSALMDWGLGHYAGGATHTELIVTTSIVTDNQYRLRSSSIYYIEEEDSDLFVEALERPIKRMEVVGK
ncbi:hypothetical protein OR1_02991 [Geobacter sp. OR-1]|uniref:hypothetical protein n=1 Tax=Geobacter sp. OR-1 TaxID=1266765 RepID=UPI000541CEC8|nr:hypothetical protein [Geobacter sp. OR-1]GAM10698.1 hypothetical protein OR1_02991 [Geobacter sp. OR-1]